MARLTSFLVLGAVAPALWACVSAEAPAPMMVARASAVPPVPAELLSPTNGKADAPFQVELGFALASRARQAVTAAERTSGPRPVMLAGAAAPTAVVVARAAPAETSHGPAAGRRVAALPRAQAPAADAGALLVKAALAAEPTEPATPAAPILYAELASAVQAGPAPAAVRTAAVAPAVRPAGPAMRRAAAARMRSAALHPPRTTALTGLAVAVVRTAAAARTAPLLPAAARTTAARKAVASPPRRDFGLHRITAVLAGWLSVIHV